MKLIIEYLENYKPEWDRLGYKHADDSGFDLRAAINEPMVVKAGTHVLIPNGVKLQLTDCDNNWEIQTRPRSGLAAKFGISIVNSPGTVDYGYRGELKTILINCGKEDFIINPGDRIAQAVICPVIHPEIVEGKVDNETTRQGNGFGSTGVK